MNLVHNPKWLTMPCYVSHVWLHVDRLRNDGGSNRGSGGFAGAFEFRD